MFQIYVTGCMLLPPEKIRVFLLPMDLKVENIHFILSALFRFKRKSKKEVLEHFKHIVKISSNRWHIFQNKVQNMWTAILKISAVLRLEF